MHDRTLAQAEALECAAARIECAADRIERAASRAEHAVARLERAQERTARALPLPPARKPPLKIRPLGTLGLDLLGLPLGTLGLDLTRSTARCGPGSAARSGTEAEPGDAVQIVRSLARRKLHSGSEPTRPT